MKYSVPFFMGNRLQGLDVPQPHQVIAPDLPRGSAMERMDAFLVDGRDLDPEEAELLAASDIAIVAVDEIATAVAGLAAVGIAAPLVE